MRQKSVVAEARQIRIATDLIRLDARLQVLEAETTLSRERLLRLYKELCGKSPPKGMLPFSTDWFMSWQPNVHSSLFMNIYHSVNTATAIEPVEALTAAYRLYLEQVKMLRQPAVLSLTRAWRLLRFFECGMLALARCTRCAGRFVVHAHEPVRRYVCGLCHMPSRAGRGAAALH